MPHTFAKLLYHVTFSTKGRAAVIDTELKPRLHAYMGGIIRELEGRAIIVGGTADHAHLLLSLPPRVALADVMRLVKTNSSRWVHEEWPRRAGFAWQTGYGAFSVSQSASEAVRGYIANQEEHHRRMTFQEEFVELLKRHGIEYDERYAWD
jgi:REP element-mobilizing transposase RayT